MAVRKRATVDISTDPSETLNLSALVQLTHESQTRAIVAGLKYSFTKNAQQGSQAPLRELLQLLHQQLDKEGLDHLVSQDRIDGFLARPRILELGMAINRLVSL